MATRPVFWMTLPRSAVVTMAFANLQMQACNFLNFNIISRVGM